MTKTLLLGAAAVLALSIGGASAAVKNTVAGPVGHFAHVVLAPAKKGAKTLYDQNDNDGGVGIVSQNFDSSVSQYDSQGADDFTVPKGQTWTVTEVDATGVYFNGYGPATSEDVYFYQDTKGLPGKAVKGGSFTNLKGKDTNGSFAISLKKGVKLKAGHYFVSVVANLGGVAHGGEWGWEDRSKQSGDLAAWQNEGGGFGICPTWASLESCLGYGPDFMFALKGKKSK